MASEMFAARLRELRQSAGLSQQELADRLGVHKDALARWEQGRRSPSWETVLALCAALGVSCEAFTVEPKDAPAPQRGRPTKRSEDKPAPKKTKRK